MTMDILPGHKIVTFISW